MHRTSRLPLSVHLQRHTHAAASSSPSSCTRLHLASFLQHRSRTLHSCATIHSQSQSHPEQYRTQLQQRIKFALSLCNAYITPFDLEVEPTFYSSSASSSPPLTVSIKDNFCLESVTQNAPSTAHSSCSITTAGSRMLSSYHAPYTATIVKKLIDAGCLLTGKTNMDEFGMGSFTSNSHYSRTINPYSFLHCRTVDDYLSVLRDDSLLLSAGGSSGGSAASVASHTCDASIGSDTGGSIRLPASYCGLYGLKPTYGRVSRYGLIAYASSLDTPSIMTKDVGVMRKVLNLIEGFDTNDSTSIANLPPTPAASFDTSTLSFSSSSSSTSQRPLTGFTIGLPHEYDILELSPEVCQLWYSTASLLQEAGATVVHCSLPNTRYALPAYYILAPAEAMSNLARYDGVRYGVAREQSTLASLSTTSPPLPPLTSLQSYYTQTRSTHFSHEVQQRILIGSFVLSSSRYQSYFEKAQRIRRVVTQDFRNVFQTNQNNQKIDLLLTPTSVGPALSFSTISSQKQSNPVSAYMNDVFTIPANLAGLPAMNIPAGVTQKIGLPLGLQLIGDYHQEGKMLDVAQWLQARRKEKEKTTNAQQEFTLPSEELMREVIERVKAEGLSPRGRKS